MKKISVFVGMLLTLFLVLPLSAQVNLGILGGVNFANANVDPDQGFDWKTRTVFGAGGVLDYSITDFVTLRFEPMYLQKGTKIEEGGNKAEFKIDYFEIPVMVMISVGTNTIKPYLMAGPAIGFLLSSKRKETIGSYSEEIDYKDYTKSMDFGLGFGAGLKLPLGTNSIFVEARYSLGLVNIAENAADPDASLKTTGIQIFAGITFPIGK